MQGATLHKIVRQFRFWGLLVGSALAATAGCMLWPASRSAYRSIHEYARDGDVAGISADLKRTPGDLDLKEDAGETPLELAVQHCRPDAIRFLVGRHADLEARAKGGATALHLAAQEGCVDGILILLAAHADLNAHDDAGRTPLARARQWNQPAAAALLEAKGAKT